MDKTEARARMMHVIRMLIVDGVSLEDVRKIKEEAYTEVVKQTYYETRRF